MITKYRVTPNPTYEPEAVGHLLYNIGVGPVLIHPDRSITVLMSDDQLDEFKRRGGVAHMVALETDPSTITPIPPLESALNAPTVVEVIEITDPPASAVDFSELVEPEEEVSQIKPQRPF